MIARDAAWDLLCEWTESDRLRIHALAVEGVMRDFAKTHGQDPERYGLAGLLHDADYDKWPEEHPKRIVAWLEEQGEKELAHAVAAHCTRTGVPRDTLLDKALVASDEISGFVIACALVRPQRTEGLEPKSIHKKLKTPAFAAGVDRAEVAEGFRIICEAVGGTPDEHLERVIASIHRHRNELGL